VAKDSQTAECACGCNNAYDGCYYNAHNCGHHYTNKDCGVQKEEAS
jgi:hypothetical protein